jgi:flagellar transcriptional activator FlhC
MAKLLSDKVATGLAIEIVKLGGRAATIEAVTGVNRRVASKLHREITNKPSPGGLLPWDPLWVVRSPTNCLHSSYFYRVFHEIGSLSQLPEKNKIFLASYKLYRDKFGQGALVDIDRAWHIHLQVNSGLVNLRQCQVCTAIHLTHASYPDIFQLCPVCYVTVDSKGRKRWKKTQLK